MSHLKRVVFLLPLTILLNVVQEADFALAVLKFVYQKDMSEHCRRRVMPSVFLGRHVMESQSQILHFSQLDVPYSCFVSLRTESGSNIILVLQLAGSDDDASSGDSCYGSESQVTVHELGETFGGYWGPLPEVVFPDGKPTPRRVYTRPTTTPTSTTSTEEPKETTTTTTPSPTKSSVKKPKKDYIRVEIPLVNVSGPFVNDPNFIHRVENYDRLHDVMRSPGVPYHTSLLPLVQFSLANQPFRRVGDKAAPAPAQEQRYDLDLNLDALPEDDEDATVDLQFLMGSTTPIRKLGKKFKYNANKLRKFNKNKGHQLFTPGPFQTSTNNPFDAYSTLHTKKSTQSSIKTTTHSKTVETWQYIEDLLKNLKNTTTKAYTTAKLEDIKYKNISQLLKKIADEPHNLSAYLDPSSWKLKPSGKESTTQKKEELTTRSFVTLKSTSMPTTKILTIPSVTETTTLPVTSAVVTNSTSTTLISTTTLAEQTANITIHSNRSGFNVSQTENQTATALRQETPTERTRVGSIGLPDLLDELGYKTDSSAIGESNIMYVNNKSTSISTGTMVDRESWQNVVQVAPAITGMLNKTAATPLTPSQAGSTRKYPRPKRFIHPIEIKYARPHALTTLQEVATTSESIYQFSDVQDFAQLVELQDDNVYGRLALRYLSKYVGRVLFDLCTYNETKGRHVFLFNSSRIVIAINNFTMKRMTVVATPARTLMHSDARCANDHIECQVSGARVCIDGMSACDGVPNCGAYDIYDEDRLKCGAYRGLQHSVVLAALTFLAVLLTVLYTVHYWLKRCVPRVSKAFFIYTNGSENVLYLDSVMRSPNDFDNESRLVYTSNIFDAEDLSLDIGSDNQRQKGSVLKRICSLFTFRRSKVNQSIIRPDSIDIGIGIAGLQFDQRKQQQQHSQASQGHSLAEIELSRIMHKHTEDVGVQTGESLEMAQKIEPRVAAPPKVFLNQRKRGSISSPRRSHNSELSLLKFIRNARQLEQNKRKEPERVHQGRRSSPHQSNMHDVATDYEEEMQTTFYESSRFLQEEDTFMTKVDVHEDPKLSTKRLRFDDATTAMRAEEEEGLNERKNRPSDHDEPPELDLEHGGREFMRFFGGKNKRTKKKSQAHTGTR